MGTEPDRNILLVKVIFGDVVEPEAVLEHVQQRRKIAQDLLADVQELQREADASGAEQGVYPWLTRRYGILSARMMIGWCLEAETAIHTGRSSNGRLLRR